MATEELVPRGLPYGEGQKIRQAKLAAGLPLEASPVSTAQGGSPAVSRATSAAGGPRSPGQILAETTPGDFPFVTEPGVAPPPDQPDSPLAALAVSAQSSFGKAVLSRLLGG